MNLNWKSPIGIFDSGIGGLTVVEQIRRVLPSEDLIYLGDTARVPYGTKSPGTIIRFACEDTEFLLHHKVKAVIVACNTVSAWALPTLRKKFHVPIFGVISPGAKMAVEKTRNHRIGIIGTAATIRSLAYNKEILAWDCHARVFVQSCPLLVTLVEEGWINHRVTRQILNEYLQSFRREKVDTLVLGCTHYPLLKDPIRSVMKRQVALVDSSEACAIYVREKLAKLKLLRKDSLRRGTVRPFVTDEVEHFEKMAARFLTASVGCAAKADLASIKKTRA